MKIIVFIIFLLFSKTAFTTGSNTNDFATSVQDSRAYLNKALSLVKEGDHITAINFLNSAIRLDPKYVDAYIARASILEKTGNLKSAIVDYTHALNLRPSYKIFYNRGVLELALKAYPEAARDFTSAIELNPQFARAYSDRGLAFLANNMLDEAKNDFIQAFTLNDKILFALEKTGEINIMQKNFQEALNNFNLLLKLDPNDSNAYLSRAKIYEALQMPDLALKDYNTSVSLGNNNIQANPAPIDPEIKSNSI
jgi:Tfp pilus assembly protein PilF